ncbi:hypothetical protein H4S06_003791 [Coemansia sp. BCRC 34490]|nr:hypothetical protein H4S06_003791 [Coemansia sp. BCRC 34490]
MAPPTLCFWFEFSSPYSMVSALRLFRALNEAPQGSARQTLPSNGQPDISEVSLAYRPILLGPVFKAIGQQPLPAMQIPTKGKYMFHDVERTLNTLDCPGFPGTPMKNWPPNPILPARMAWLLAQGFEHVNAVDSGAEQTPSAPPTTESGAGPGPGPGSVGRQDRALLRVLSEFVWRVYETEFIHGKDIGDPDTMAALWDTYVAGSAPRGTRLPSGNRAVEMAEMQAVKDGLRGATQEAVDLGLFGAPSFTTDDGDLYWGNDRLLDAIAHHRVKKQINQASGFCVRSRNPSL